MSAEWQRVTASIWRIGIRDKTKYTFIPGASDWVNNRNLNNRPVYGDQNIAGVIITYEYEIMVGFLGQATTWTVIYNEILLYNFHRNNWRLMRRVWRLNNFLKKVSMSYITICKHFLRWSKFTVFKLNDAWSRNFSETKHAKETTTNQKVIKKVLKTKKCWGEFQGQLVTFIFSKILATNIDSITSYSKIREEIKFMYVCMYVYVCLCFTRH